MMNDHRKEANVWFRFSIGVGVVLGLLLLVQTVVTYRYVGRGLVRDEARREADRRSASVARTARLSGIHEASALTPVLRELVREAPKQIAWMRILDIDGKTLAATDSADAAPAYSRQEMLNVFDDGEKPPRKSLTASGPVLTIVNPLRVPPPDRDPGTRRVPPPPIFLEIAMYADGIVVHFGPLRQNLIVGMSAAFALLGAIIIICLHFGSYLRGREMEKELALARRVQLDLLPDERTAATQIEFAGRCAPAWQVGGDLYDAFDAGEGQTALILGDVSGKGVSAALLMGVVQGAVRASCAADSAADHENAAEHLNDLLCRKTASERFVTLFWSYVNSEDGVLRYVNAGHCPPLLARGGEHLTDMVRLETGGPVLGVLPDAPYEQAEVAVQPGDLLVLFSDGIIEALDSQEEQFGEHRLMAVIEREWSKSPSEICDAILAEVRHFLGKESAQDDQTVVITRFELRQRESMCSAEASGLITVT